MQHTRLTCAFIAAFAVTGAAAYAKPIVHLTLDGQIVRRDAKGVETHQPVAGVALEPGATVRYAIVATNAGSDAAKRLTPVAKIPAGTRYEAGSATASRPQRIEFSLDGGKTWATSPTVRVQTPTGIVEMKADPARYTTVRWISDASLAAHAKATYTYEVRVK
ncbi:MAG: hypothetical protein NVSMB19_26880 [Vulcanimicrobiaceae bacterium]